MHIREKLSTPRRRREASQGRTVIDKSKLIRLRSTNTDGASNSRYSKRSVAFSRTMTQPRDFGRLDWQSITAELASWDSDPLKSLQFAAKVKACMDKFLPEREITTDYNINCFSYLDGVLAVGTLGTEINVYRVDNESMEELGGPLKGHRRFVSGLCLALGAKVLFSVAYDGKIGVWVNNKAEVVSGGSAGSEGQEKIKELKRGGNNQSPSKLIRVGGGLGKPRESPKNAEEKRIGGQRAQAEAKDKHGEGGSQEPKIDKKFKRGNTLKKIWRSVVKIKQKATALAKKDSSEAEESGYYCYHKKSESDKPGWYRLNELVKVGFNKRFQISSFTWNEAQKLLFAGTHFESSIFIYRLDLSSLRLRVTQRVYTSLPRVLRILVDRSGDELFICGSVRPGEGKSGKKAHEKLYGRRMVLEGDKEGKETPGDQISGQKSKSFSNSPNSQKINFAQNQAKTMDSEECKDVFETLIYNLDSSRNQKQYLFVQKINLGSFLPQKLSSQALTIASIQPKITRIRTRAFKTLQAGKTQKNSENDQKVEIPKIAIKRTKSVFKNRKASSQQARILMNTVNYDYRPSVYKFDEISAVDIHDFEDYFLTAGSSKNPFIDLYKHVRGKKYRLFKQFFKGDLEVTRASISDDLRYVIASSFSNTLKIYSMEVEEDKKTKMMNSGFEANAEYATILSMKLSQDASILVTLDSSGCLTIWSCGQSGENNQKNQNREKKQYSELSAILEDPEDMSDPSEVFPIDISHDNLYIVYAIDGMLKILKQSRRANQDHKFTKFQFNTQHEVVEGPENLPWYDTFVEFDNNDLIFTLTFLPQKHDFLVGGEDCEAAIWLYNPKIYEDGFKRAQILKDHNNPVTSASIVADDSMLLLGHEDGAIVVWSQRGCLDEATMAEMQGPKGMYLPVQKIFEGESGGSCVRFLHIIKDKNLIIAVFYQGCIRVLSRERLTGEYHEIQHIPNTIIQANRGARHRLEVALDGQAVHFSKKRKRGESQDFGSEVDSEEDSESESSSYGGGVSLSRPQVSLLMDERYMVTLLPGSDICDLWHIDCNGVHRIRALTGGAVGLAGCPNSLEMVYIMENGFFRGERYCEKLSRPGSFQELRAATLNQVPAIPQCFKTYKILCRLFSSKTDFLDKNVLSDFIDHTAKQVFPEEDKLQHQIRVHAEINILLVCVASRAPDCLKRALDLFGYSPAFHEASQTSIDPLDAAMAINHIGSLSVFAKYFTKNQETLNTFAAYFTKKRFLRALRTNSNDLKVLMIKQFLVEPVIPSKQRETSEEQDLFMPEYPLEKKDQVVAFPTTSQVLTSSLRTQIDQKALRHYGGSRGRRGLQGGSKAPKTESICRSMQNHHHKSTEVRYLITRYPINPSVFSSSTREFLEVLSLQSEKLMVSDLHYLLKHIWDYNYWSSTVGLGICSWACFVTFLLHTIWYRNSIWLGLISLTLSTFFLVYEGVVASWDLPGWSKSVFNFIDLYQYVSIPIILTFNLSSRLDESNVQINAWVNVTILLSGFRALGESRVYSPVRYMIAMLMQSFKDMAAFNLLLICSIFYFAFVRINVSKTHDMQKMDMKDFLEALDYYYNVAFGQWDPVEGKNETEVITYLLSGFFLALVMMNLLIAIISLTFEQFQERRDLVDLRVINEILLERANFFSVIGRLFGCSGRRGRAWEADGRLYSCFVVNDQTEDSGVEDQLERVEEQVEACSQRIEGLEKLVDKGNRKILEELRFLRKKIKQANPSIGVSRGSGSTKNRSRKDNRLSRRRNVHQDLEIPGNFDKMRKKSLEILMTKRAKSKEFKTMKTPYFRTKHILGNLEEPLKDELSVPDGPASVDGSPQNPRNN